MGEGREGDICTRGKRHGDDVGARSCTEGAGVGVFGTSMFSSMGLSTSPRRCLMQPVMIEPLSMLRMKSSPMNRIMPNMRCFCFIMARALWTGKSKR